MKDERQLLSIAKKCGTPVYVYDGEVIKERVTQLQTTFPYARIHYAVKANSNPTLLKLIRDLGLSVEAVSLGELALAKAVGFTSERISFTCSNLTAQELKSAAKSGARVHLDSLHQLEIWGKYKLGKEVSLRLNQGIGAGHHHHVITGGPDSKFGINLSDLPKALHIAQEHNLTIVGFQQHIGSNVLDTAIFLSAMELLLETARQFPDVAHVDFGGGFGIPYRPDQRALDLRAVGKGAQKLLKQFESSTGRPLAVSFEPGRFIVAESGTLLVTVVDRKSTSEHNFVGVNSGFNHLIRPAMYDAYHPIENISRTTGRKETVTIAGNICESGDLFATTRPLVSPALGDVLAIRNAGAYGFSMASHYNLHKLPREILRTGATTKDISFDPRQYAR